MSRGSSFIRVLSGGLQVGVPSPPAYPLQREQIPSAGLVNPRDWGLGGHRGLVGESGKAQGS